MSTFMLTWNPRQERPANLDEAVAQISRGKPYRGGWSAGNRRHLAVGSRVFLVRQGKPPKGVVASEFSVTEPEPTNDPDDHSKYFEIDFTMVFTGEVGHILPLDVVLADPELREVNWGSQRGGIEFSADQAARLEILWREFLESAGKQEVSR